MNHYQGGGSSQKFFEVDYLSATILDSFATLDSFSPGLAFDGLDIYENEQVGAKIHRHEGFSSSVTDSVATTTGDRDIAKKRLGDLFALNFIQNKVYQYSGHTSTLLDSVSVAAVDNEEESIGFDSDENLLFGGDQNNKIWQFDGFSNTILDSISVADQQTVVTWDGSNLVSINNGGADLVYKHLGFSTTVQDTAAAVDALVNTQDHDRALPPQVTTDDTYWCSAFADKLKINDGFSSTVVQSIASPNILPTGIAFDGTDTYSLDENSQKAYHHSGFTTTITASFSVAAVDTTPRGCFMDTDYQWIGRQADKYYQNTGFSSTVADSIAINAIDTSPDDLYVTEGFVFISGDQANKIYKFETATGTLVSSVSQYGSNGTGVAFDGDNVLMCDYILDKMLKYVGETSTLQDSVSVNDNTPYGLYVIEAINTYAAQTDISFEGIAVGEIVYGAETPIEFGGQVNVTSDRDIETDIALSNAVAGVNLHGYGETEVAFGQQVVGWNMHQTVETEIEFQGVGVEITPPTFDAETGVEFGSSVTAIGSVFNREVENQINLGQLPQRTYTETVTTPVEFDGLPGLYTNTGIALANAGVANTSKTPESEVEFNNTVARNIVATRALETSAAFESRVSAYIEGANLNTYAPIDVGAAVGCLTKPPSSVSLSTRSGVTFSYGETSLTVRNPEFGNTESFDTKRIFRRNRGNDPISFRDCRWPVDETHRINFIALRRKEIENLMSFLNLSLGRRISWVSHENRTFYGIVMNPDTAIQFVRRDWYNVSLEILVEESQFSIAVNASNNLALGNTGSGLV